MSYILDALRRADAERRGAIAPGELTAPGVLSTENDELPPPQRPLRWVAAGLLAAGALWGLWAWVTAERPVVSAAPAQELAQTPAPAPIPARAPTPAPAPPDISTTNKASAGTLPVAEPATTAPTPRNNPAAGGDEALPPALAALTQQQPSANSAAHPSPAAPATQAATTKPAPATPTAASNEVLPLADLPDAFRREVPQFTISGSVYSTRAEDRMLIINGQFFHEGDLLGKGVTLRQIRLKAAVLEFRGQRYLVRY